MSEELQDASNEAGDVSAEAVTASGEGVVEYDGGSTKNPMEALVEEGEKNNVTHESIVDEQDDELAEEKPQKIPVDTEVQKNVAEAVESLKEAAESAPKIIELKEGELPTIKESERPGFDPAKVQDARVDSPVEGGTVKPRSTGQMKEHVSDVSQEGSQIKPISIDIDSIKDKFEVTGFTIEYTDGDHVKNCEVRDYFDDEETAQASVNGDKYLMPLKSSGYKVARIVSGAPIICYNERQTYSYVNDRWTRLI